MHSPDRFFPEKNDLFVHDRQTKKTRKIEGTQGVLRSSVSADGRFVAFYAEGTFVHDLQTGKTQRISNHQDNTSPPALSADGRFIAYGTPGIHVYDRQTDKTELISTDTDKPIGPVISADGRFVAYLTELNVFVHDRQTHKTQDILVSSRGIHGNQKSQRHRRNHDISISANGRFVAFNSMSTNLAGGIYDHESVAFIHDRLTHKTRYVSMGLESLWSPLALSADGRFLSYENFIYELPTVIPPLATGVINTPLAGSQHTETITIDLSISAPKGLQSVMLRFSESQPASTRWTSTESSIRVTHRSDLNTSEEDPAFIVCGETDSRPICTGTDFNGAISVNPAEYGAVSGPVDINVWVRDQSGVSTRVATHVIQWVDRNQNSVSGAMSYASASEPGWSKRTHSSDGRFETFEAPNTPTTNASIFVRDQQTGETQLHYWRPRRPALVCECSQPCPQC